MSLSRFHLSVSCLTALFGLFVLSHLEADDQSPWENEILAFEAADQEEQPPEGAILFIGSSSIRGWRSLPDDFPEHEVINRGFGGSQIGDSIHYADRIVLPYRPSMIVFYAGENDIAAGKSPQEVADSFRTFVDVVREELPGTRIAFISMKPSPSRWALAEKMRQGNERIRAYASEAPGVDFIDVWPDMLNAADREPREEIFLGDKLHMNRDGYRIWIDRVRPYLAHHAAAQKESRAHCHR